ncbi:MAG: hypothetical protein IJ254_01415 [Succinivibrio sp.]|jgi:hypothetical protein|nr:hypothetical protein [Succinivibrio sp.]
MAKITLARAFVLRGFFRKTISELDREIRAEDLTSEIDTTEEFFKDESTEKENDTKLDKLIELYLKAQAYLEQLNNEIDNANNRVINGKSTRHYLNLIECLKERRRLYTDLQSDLTDFHEVKKEFDAHEFNPDTKQLGRVVEKHYRINTKLNLPKEVKNLNKQIRIAEELVSERNATVFLSSDATFWNEAVDFVENADIC